MKKLLLTCLMLFVALGLFAGAKGEKASGGAATGPKSDAPTIADMKGIPAGKYQGQYELAEYEKLSGKKLEFKQNPIFDNAGLPLCEIKISNPGIGDPFQKFDIYLY